MIIINSYTPGGHYINPSLLWEYDLNSFDWQASKTIVIQRIVELGSPEDYYAAFDLYGIDNFKEAIKDIPYLSPIDINFVCMIFNLKKEDLKCYTRTQSNPEHWNY